MHDEGMNFGMLGDNRLSTESASTDDYKQPLTTIQPRIWANYHGVELLF
jgi:hypothetical protein